ncbi:hypothetical protein ASF87_04140 [Microbacterium sp. Leaf161]|uniref:hypothetical protein n=1 Tax=Microbacterium sp. Leaf161 TaxID=1736281 RepID=UPI0006FE0667|nr:hypothetical protein [Microbacterium sp. Leaf161]KQR48123.1 hypothetical protein ASF87_04140 [Microbacterium sp. Leaf161]
MNQPTHIRQINDSVRGALVDYVRPYPDQIRFSLNQMNGMSTWAWSLWRAPEGADLLESIPLSGKYMQCAGAADALTIEVRRLDTDGTAHQYTIGKPDGDLSGAPTEVIHWDEGRHSTTVYPHEVFTADEAAVIFYTYFLTDMVSQPYELRDLHLSWPKPESDAGVS